MSIVNYANTLSQYKDKTTISSDKQIEQIVKGFIYHFKHELENKPSYIKVLNLLKNQSMSRYAKGSIGCVWIGQDYIAKKLGLGRTTVWRAIKFFVKHGLIKVYDKTINRNGGSLNGKSVYVFQNNSSFIISERETTSETTLEKQREQDDVLTAPSEKQHVVKEESKILKIKKEKDNKTICNNIENLDHIELKDLDSTYLPKSIPTEFVSTVSKIYSDRADIIYTVWGIVKRAFSKMNLSPITDIAVSAFKSTIFAKKQGRVKKTLGAFLYGTLMNMIFDYLNEKVEGNYNCDEDIFSDLYQIVEKVDLKDNRVNSCYETAKDAHYYVKIYHPEYEVFGNQFYEKVIDIVMQKSGANKEQAMHLYNSAIYMYGLN